MSKIEKENALFPQITWKDCQRMDGQDIICIGSITFLCQQNQDRFCLVSLRFISSAIEPFIGNWCSCKVNSGILCLSVKERQAWGPIPAKRQVRWGYPQITNLAGLNGHILRICFFIFYEHGHFFPIYFFCFDSQKKSSIIIST